MPIKIITPLDLAADFGSPDPLACAVLKIPLKNPLRCAKLDRKVALHFLSCKNKYRKIMYSR